MRANMQVESGRYPCGICVEGVSRNSIQWGECKKWVYKKCSGVKGKLKEDPDYTSICAKCMRGGCAEGGAEEQEVILEDGSALEYVNSFCYLGDITDMMGAAGCCGEASGTRVRGLWDQRVCRDAD